MGIQKRTPRLCSTGFGRVSGLALVLGAVILTPLSGWAFQITTGLEDLKMSWDTTVKYSAALRLGTQRDKLADSDRNAFNVSQDDGDRNFTQGLISNRLDLLSEFDAEFKGFGVRVSGAGWYDFVYNSPNHNDSEATANSVSVSHDEFTEDTRDLHGRKVELLDAFAFGKVDMGPTTLSMRAGQYTLQWGESLFFGGNAIAGGMSPVDVVKALSVPNSQVKEILMPVPQVSGQLQIGEKVSVAGYYQLRWRKSRIPAAGSYFSDSDYIDDGGEVMLFGPGPKFGFFRGSDSDASNAHQGGVQVKVRPGAGVDLGFYAINYHDKFPQMYVNPGAGFNPTTGQVGEYFFVYPEDVHAFGMSATKTFGDWNLATEVSTRRNAPLSSGAGDVSLHPDGDNSDNPLYAVGNTVHANFNWFATFGPSFIANEALFLGEVGWNKVTSYTQNRQIVQPNAERSGWGFRMVYEPTYRQVLDGMDVSIPLGFGYAPKGKSAAGPVFGPDKGGDLSVGLNISYLDAWRVALSYTHYYGPADGFIRDNARTFKQTLADRDFLSFSVRRTF